MAMNLSWGVSVIHHLFYCSRNLFRKCIWPITSWSAGKVFLFTVVIIVQWWDFTWDTTEWHSFIIRSSHVPPTPGHHHTCAWHGHLHQFLLFSSLCDLSWPLAFCWDTSIPNYACFVWIKSMTDRQKNSVFLGGGGWNWSPTKLGLSYRTSSVFLHMQHFWRSDA